MTFQADDDLATELIYCVSIVKEFVDDIIEILRVM